MHAPRVAFMCCLKLFADTKLLLLWLVGSNRVNSVGVNLSLVPLLLAMGVNSSFSSEASDPLSVLLSVLLADSSESVQLSESSELVAPSKELQPGPNQ